MSSSSARINPVHEVSHERQRIESALVSSGADSAQIADTIVATYAQIEAALTPIIGSRGVAALCKRSVYVAGQTFPWLLGAHENLQSAMDLAALRSAIAQQDRACAAAGGGCLLHTFCEVLAGLVGASLTGRLLDSVWARLLSGAPVQDNSQ